MFTILIAHVIVDFWMLHHKTSAVSWFAVHKPAESA
jgi:hypothetical protein